MKNTIDELISEELDNIEVSPKEVIDDIKNKIDTVNKNVKEAEYKKTLIEIINKLDKIGYKIEYNEDMNVKELENLLKNIEV